MFLRVRRNVFVGKINVRLDVREHVHQIIAEPVDALRKFSGKLFVGGGQRQFRARMDQISDRFGLGEVKASVEKRAAREFAGFGRRAPFSSSVSRTSLAGRMPP